MYDVELSTTTTDVYIEEGSVILTRERSHQISGDQASFFSTLNDLDVYPSLLEDLLDKLRTIGCITHSRGSTGTEGFDFVDLHKLLIGFHQANELLPFLLGDTSFSEGFLPEAKRDTYELHFRERLDATRFVKTFDEETYSIGADINTGEVRFSHDRFRFAFCLDNTCRVLAES